MQQRADVGRISGRKKCESEQRGDQSCDLRGVLPISLKRG
jgi:hypothetical protein